MNFVDVLRITYDRPKGSILPSSRTYRFPREHATALGDGDGKVSVAMTTHPKLRAAIEELDGILKAKIHQESIAREILDEIELLEEDIAMRTECLKVLAKRIPAGE